MILMVKPNKLIVYMSDFGVQDPYVGIVHGVIERLSSGKVKVIDLTHEIKAFSILSGAYILYTSYKWFPPGTVFLAVVDPGVGTERKAVAVETTNYFFVGPDNGLLWPSIAEDGVMRAHSIENSDVFLKPVSASFHGRDVFAPAATLLALGVDITTLGPKVDPNKLVKLELKQSCKEEGTITAKVVHVDRFGNVALGLEETCYKTLCSSEGVIVDAGDQSVEAKCMRVFSLAKSGELVFYINSLGFPELAVNLGSAAELLGIHVGDQVTIKPRTG